MVYNRNGKKALKKMYIIANTSDEARNFLVSPEEMKKARDEISSAENELKYLKNLKKDTQRPDYDGQIKESENNVIKLKESAQNYFDQIRFTAGSAHEDDKGDKPHAVFYSMFVFDKKTEKFFALVLPYRKPLVLANGHGSTKTKGATPYKDLKREVYEETSIILAEEEGIDAFKIHRKECLADSEMRKPKNLRGDKKHNKIVYFFMDEVDDITTSTKYPIFDLKGQPNPIDSETGQPFFVVATGGVLQDVLYFGHQWVLEVANKYLEKNLAEESDMAKLFATSGIYSSQKFQQFQALREESHYC